MKKLLNKVVKIEFGILIKIKKLLDVECIMYVI